MNPLGLILQAHRYIDMPPAARPPMDEPSDGLLPVFRYIHVPGRHSLRRVGAMRG